MLQTCMVSRTEVTICVAFNLKYLNIFLAVFDTLVNLKEDPPKRSQFLFCHNLVNWNRLICKIMIGNNCCNVWMLTSIFCIFQIGHLFVVKKSNYGLEELVMNLRSYPEDDMWQLSVDKLTSLLRVQVTGKTSFT